MKIGTHFLKNYYVILDSDTQTISFHKYFSQIRIFYNSGISKDTENIRGYELIQILAVILLNFVVIMGTYAVCRACKRRNPNEHAA